MGKIKEHIKKIKKLIDIVTSDLLKGTIGFIVGLIVTLLVDFVPQSIPDFFALIFVLTSLIFLVKSLKYKSDYDKNVKIIFEKEKDKATKEICDIIPKKLSKYINKFVLSFLLFCLLLILCSISIFIKNVHLAKQENERHAQTMNLLEQNNKLIKQNTILLDSFRKNLLEQHNELIKQNTFVMDSIKKCKVNKK